MSDLVSKNSSGRKIVFKCPFCDVKYICDNKNNLDKVKRELYMHIEVEHPEMLNDEITPARAYFNFKYNKTSGKCVMCRKETKWNEATERYERFCSQKCKEKYREEFKKRMVNKYGKEHLLDNPDQQKKMLGNRSISGEYTWSTDSRSKIKYTGSYEREFLEFLDIVMRFSPNDIIAPAPQVFEYVTSDKRKRLYIPDFFIPSLNLIVEIKDGGSNPNKHHKIQAIDKEKERLKDIVMAKQTKYNYVKVVDKDYSIFLDKLASLKNLA